jgi:hypothetical protein
MDKNNFTTHPKNDEFAETIVGNCLSDRYAVCCEDSKLLIDKDTGDVYLDILLFIPPDVQVESGLINNPEEEYKQTSDYYLELVEEEKQARKKRELFKIKMDNFIKEENKKMVNGNN